MADIENGGGVDVYATAEPDTASELGFTCCVACMAATVLAVSLTEALLLLHYLAATATTMTPWSVIPRALAWAGLLAAALDAAFGAVCCCTAADLCIHGDATGERQRNAPPPVHAAMD